MYSIEYVFDKLENGDYCPYNYLQGINKEVIVLNVPYSSYPKILTTIL